MLTEWTESTLWDAIIELQNTQMYTASGLPFSYFIKRGRDGSYNKELIIDRRKESKTLAWSSVRLAFQSAVKTKGEVVSRPKALGDIRGISYIYPIFYRLGIIEVPEKIAEKMAVTDGCTEPSHTHREESGAPRCQ
jgi:hypothetical protein